MILAFLVKAALPIIISLIVGIAFAVVVSIIQERFTVLAGVSFIVSLGVVFGLWALLSAYTTVEYQTVGLISRYGNLVPNTVLAPGVHWVTPFVDRVVIVRTNRQSYETSDNPDTSQANFRDYTVAAQTSDGQQISVSYTVIFSMPNDASVIGVLEDIGDVNSVVENVVKANSRSLTRLVAQSYEASDLYGGQKVFEYSAEVENGGEIEISGNVTVVKGLRQQLTDSGVVFQQFLLRKISFDPDYVQAIENKQIASENITTQKYNADAAEFTKQQTIREEEAKARGKVLDAEAEAKRTELQADAEAYAIEQKGLALRRNPEVLQWEMVGNLANTKWIMPFDSVQSFIPLDIVGTTP